MHAREVGREKPKTLHIEMGGKGSWHRREMLTTKPNELGFVVEWVVEKRESTGHAQM